MKCLSILLEWYSWELFSTAQHRATPTGSADARSASVHIVRRRHGTRRPWAPRRSTIAAERSTQPTPSRLWKPSAAGGQPTPRRSGRWIGRSTSVTGSTSESESGPTTFCTSRSTLIELPDGGRPTPRKHGNMLATDMLGTVTATTPTLGSTRARSMPRIRRSTGTASMRGLSRHRAVHGSTRSGQSGEAFRTPKRLSNGWSRLIVRYAPTVVSQPPPSITSSPSVEAALESARTSRLPVAAVTAGRTP